MELETAQSVVYITSTAAIALVLVLLAIACLREVHWWPRRLTQSSRKGWRRPLWALTGPDEEASAPWAPGRAERLWIFFVAVLSQWLIVWTGHLLAGWSQSDFLARVWERFTTAGDAPHYLWLAENGYATSGEEAMYIVFYPLYPALIRALTGLLGGLENAYALCGMVISQVCFGLASVEMVRLAGRYLPRERVLTVLAAWLMYPFVFFCFGVYTEGLFMWLSLLTLRLLEERRWVAAGLAGMLAALCRTQGVALLFPAVLCWLRQPKGTRRQWSALALLGIPLGFGLYLLCNRLVCGDWFAYLAYQSAPPWYNTAHWIGENLATQLGVAVENPWLAGIIYIPQLVLYFVGLLAAAGLLLRRRALPVVLYSVAYLGMSYLHGWMISGGRYMLGCYALFLSVATVKRRWVRVPLLAAEFAALVYMATAYMQSQAIM